MYFTMLQSGDHCIDLQIILQSSSYSSEDYQVMIIH